MQVARLQSRYGTGGIISPHVRRAGQLRAASRLPRHSGIARRIARPDRDPRGNRGRVPPAARSSHPSSRPPAGARLPLLPPQTDRRGCSRPLLLGYDKVLPDGPSALSERLGAGSKQASDRNDAVEPEFEAVHGAGLLRGVVVAVGIDERFGQRLEREPRGYLDAGHQLEGIAVARLPRTRTVEDV